VKKEVMFIVNSFFSLGQAIIWLNTKYKEASDTGALHFEWTIYDYSKEKFYYNSIACIKGLYFIDFFIKEEDLHKYLYVKTDYKKGGKK